MAFRSSVLNTHSLIPIDALTRLCQTEERHYCFGEVDGEVLTVRFTYRASVIRIIGAGYWRKGKAIYERENKIHR